MSSLFVQHAAALRSPLQPSEGPVPLDGRGDFHFLAGRWNVAHRRLRRRLAGDTCWEEFGGVCETRLVIGGLGNVDDNILELPAGTYRAATLRLFDARARVWSIWWIDGHTQRLERPVKGRFSAGIGTFLGDDVLDDGRSVRVRFTWSEITARSARWEQAFSADGRAAWEENWIMCFGRIE